MLPNINSYTGTKKSSEMTIQETLAENRVLFLVGEIHEGSATSLIMQLLYLENKSPGKEIQLYINSPGGSLHDSLAVCDTIRMLKSPVRCICLAIAMSGGALILSAGTKGKRSALKHSRIMIHQPLGTVGGTAANIKIEIEEMRRCKKEVTQELANNTGKTYEQIFSDCERDYYMTAEEALSYGIIDEIIQKDTKDVSSKK